MNLPCLFVFHDKGSMKSYGAPENCSIYQFTNPDGVQAIGLTVQTLKEEGIFDDTLIVFTSDNGGLGDGVPSNYPLRGAKHYNFEGGVKTAALLRGPKIAAGKLQKWSLHDVKLYILESN